MSCVENIYYFTISLLSVMRDWVNQSGTCIEYQTLETKLETTFNFVYFNQLMEFVHSTSFLFKFPGYIVQYKPTLSLFPHYLLYYENSFNSMKFK